MAHPKSKTSKQRKRKRRTHFKIDVPQVSICKSTGEAHQFHRAYYHGDDLYYRGKVLIKGEDIEIVE